MFSYLGELLDIRDEVTQTFLEMSFTKSAEYHSLLQINSFLKQYQWLISVTFLFLSISFHIEWRCEIVRISHK